jgi:hypothetical protein
MNELEKLAELVLDFAYAWVQYYSFYALPWILTVRVRLDVKWGSTTRVEFEEGSSDLDDLYKKAFEHFAQKEE